MTTPHLPLGQFWCAGSVPSVSGPAVPLGRSIHSFIHYTAVRYDTHDTAYTPPPVGWCVMYDSVSGRGPARPRVRRAARRRRTQFFGPAPFNSTNRSLEIQHCLVPLSGLMVVSMPHFETISTSHAHEAVSSIRRAIGCCIGCGRLHRLRVCEVAAGRQALLLEASEQIGLRVHPIPQAGDPAMQLR